MNKITISAKQSELNTGVLFVEEELKKLRLKPSDIGLNVMSIEEILCKAIALAPSEESQIVISARSFLGTLEIRVQAPGPKIDAGELTGTDEYTEGLDDESAQLISRLMSRLLGNNITVRRYLGKNVFTLTVRKSKYANLITMVSALVSGLIAGALIKAVLPEIAAAFLADDIFSIVTTIFFNCLKMVVAPLVFFSIASSIADFSDLKALGRIALKVVLCYVASSVISALIGIVINRLIPIGNPELQACVGTSISQSVSAAGASANSLKDMILDIFPSDIVSPFLNSSMLQIIFLAALFGFVGAKLSEKDASFRNFLSTGNSVMSQITTIIIKVLPLSVFCSMAKMVINLDLSSFADILVFVPVTYAGHAVLFAVYAILLLIFGLNPLKFYKGFFQAIITAFSTSSSNATLPTSIRACEQNLGIDKSIYSFSIPLGSTINMNGACVAFITASMFIGRIFGVDFGPAVMLPLTISVVTLAMGAPGVPNAGLVCIAMLLPQIGIPSEAVSIIMGVYTFSDMMATAVNVTGDAVISTLVAKTEGMLDKNIYNGTDE